MLCVCSSKSELAPALLFIGLVSFWVMTMQKERSHWPSLHNYDWLSSQESGIPRVHSSGTRASQTKRRSLQGETLDEDLSLQEDSPHREGLHTERRDSCWSMSGIGGVCMVLLFKINHEKSINQ